MANNLGTLAATGVFHTALGLVLKKLPFISELAKNIKPEMVQNNDDRLPFNVNQILKNYNATINAYDRGVSGSYAPANDIVLPADQYFNLSNWPAVSIKLSATEVNQIVDSANNVDARAAAIQLLLRRGFNAFATQLVTLFYAQVNEGNFPSSYVSQVGSMDYMHLGSVVDVFLQNDALDDKQPPMGILGIDSYRELVNSLTPIPNYDGVTDAVTFGEVRDGVSGARAVARYNVALPADAPRGFLLSPMSIVYAQRLPYEETLPNDPVYLEPIVDPDTGFSVMYREHKDPTTGEVTRSISTMIGFAKGLSQYLVRLTPA